MEVGSKPHRLRHSSAQASPLAIGAFATVSVVGEPFRHGRVGQPFAERRIHPITVAAKDDPEPPTKPIGGSLMPLQPHMGSSLHGFSLTEEPRFLRLDGMAVGSLRMEGERGGGGTCVSPDPRIVVMLDDARLALSERSGAVRPLSPVSYVPVGPSLSGVIAAKRRFHHLGLHFDARRLAGLVGGGRTLDRPFLMAASARAQALAQLLAE